LGGPTIAGGDTYRVWWKNFGTYKQLWMVNFGG